MSKCARCGQKIRFIKRTGKKALIVNPRPVFIVPDNTNGEEYVLTNGDMRKGRPAADGLRGFTVHQC